MVTTNAAGCSGVVTHQVDGLLVPVKDAIELANAILLSAWKNRTIDLPMDAVEYQVALNHRINTSTFVKKPHTPKHAATDDLAKSFK